MKLLLTIAVITVAFAAFTQEREDRKDASFDSITEKITTATGWELNESTGKWIENKNAIYDKKCPESMFSLVSQNFKWIKAARITCNGKRYYVIIHESIGGTYKYPEIRQDWQEHKEMNYFILDSTGYADLNKALNAKDSTESIIKSKLYGNITDQYVILGGEHLYNDQNLINSIVATINNPKEYYPSYSFYVNVQTVKGIKVVRFRLPESKRMSTDYQKEYFEIKHTDLIKLAGLK
ncbi:MAG: hypothetical protein V4604_11965 [Bacteroidota bacterium]